MIIFYSYMRLEPVAPFLLSPRLIVEPKRVIAAQSDVTWLDYFHSILKKTEL